MISVIVCLLSIHNVWDTGKNLNMVRKREGPKMYQTNLWATSNSQARVCIKQSRTWKYFCDAGWWTIFFGCWANNYSCRWKIEKRWYHRGTTGHICNRMSNWYHKTSGWVWRALLRKDLVQTWRDGHGALWYRLWFEHPIWISIWLSFIGLTR